MALDREEVRRIAALARLEFEPAEEELLVEQLGQIVDYFDQLQEVDTGAAGAPEGGLESAAAHPEADDEPAPCLPREAFLENAPQSVDGFLAVPRVKAG